MSDYDKSTPQESYTDEIKKRLEAATPGPWKCYGKPERSQYFTVETPDGRIWQIADAIYASEVSAEAIFIANAPTDIKNLLAEREVLREALEFYSKGECFRDDLNPTSIWSCVYYNAQTAEKALSFDPTRRSEDKS